MRLSRSKNLSSGANAPLCRFSHGTATAVRSNLLGGVVVADVMDRDELQHLKLTFAIRRHDGSHISNLFAQQRPPNRRGRRDEPLRYVRLFAGDQFVAKLFVLAGIEDR